MINISMLLRSLTRSARWPALLTDSKLWPSVPLQSATRLLTGTSPSSILEYSRANLQFRSQERFFKRKIRAIYKRYSDIPDGIVVQGRHHVYFEEGGSVYRMDLVQGERNVEEVLRTDGGGHGEAILQRVRISPKEGTLAATLRCPGSADEDTRCLLVRLRGSPDPPKPLLTLDRVFSFEWATDEILFFTTVKGLRCHRVFRLDLSAAEPEITLVHEEQDPEFFVEVSSSRDRKVLTVNCSSKSSSEVWLIDCSTPFAPPRLVQPRLPGVLYHVEHRDQQLYVLANTAAGREYQLLRVPLSCPSMGNWEPLFTPAPGTGLRDMELLRDHCVLAVRTPGGPLKLQTVPLADPTCVSTLQLPTWACAMETQPDQMTDSESLRFLLSSPVHPPALFHYSPREHRLHVQKDSAGPPLPPYHTTRLEAPSQDGTMVPLTVFHACAWDDLKGVPLLLHVYGAYGLDLHMGFSPEKRLLLEEGWALAYCHVRGGGERGLGWHQAGRLEGKQRGVEDLAACVQRLFDLGVSRPTLAALTARSAGAVLAGALCNQHPHLLRAVTLQAPFLDVLGTMLDPTLPLTIEERGEWGDPLAEPQDRDYIASYCPCHNITPQLYPSMLITAYEADRRVPLAGVQRYLQRLTAAIQAHVGSRSAPESEHTHPSIVLDLQPGGAHFGPEDFGLSLEEAARQIAFLYSELGMDGGGSRKRRR
ncbi:prolyl endopeptidase-like [Anguilla anguilla]|uniref:prolyl endopeptidase-like n=1 Tax=Anguilla anguilla TaxID=7936 RepID=UPI0015A9793C|nr:prolyl endopeptidase-like [Anguilla anguilla]